MIQISAVIFAFNEEKYIEQAIQSVLAQTYSVLEIIVIDDFSTDNTPELVKELNSKHASVKYYLSDKKGKFHAYKTGLNKVKTDLFFIMAGDDAIELDYVQSGLDYLAENKLDFFYSSYKICDSDLKVQREFIGPKSIYMTRDLLCKNWVGGFLFAKSHVIKHILKLKDERIQFEDWVGSIMFSKLFGFVNFKRDTKYLYRRHSQATTVKLNKAALRERDIKLYEFLLSSDRKLFAFNSKELSLIAERILLNKLILEKEKLSFTTFMKVFNSKSIRIVEKIKLLIIKSKLMGEKQIDNFFSLFNNL